MRKLVAPHIKMHGERLQKMEDIIIAEIQDLIGRLGKENGQPFDPHNHFGELVVISTTLCL